MAHGYDQIPMHKLEDQRGMIHRAMDVIEKFTGKRSGGWLGPGLTQTLDTADLLAEPGVRYIGDWVWA
jgi:peptidoglycan/xylan/chitin deacetylase (PgdA/CDA1 family)